MKLLKRILVVDWLDKFGGAERVISKLEEIFGFKEIYSLTNVMKPEDQEKMIHGKALVVNTTVLQIFGKLFRAFFFTFHYFVSNIKINKSANTIISSSHAVAKGVKKASENQVHISYFQARNFKYIWDDAPLYFGRYLFFVKPLLNYLQKVDVKQAKRPDYIISNSKFVQTWVREKYGRESVIIYPPVSLKNFPLQVEKQEYYVAVGRIVAYKRFDLIIEAFKGLNKKLIVLGDGPELKNLQQNATLNIEFRGFVDETTVRDVVSKAKAFIHIGVEDFGIAPIEAQSCGTPIIAYKQGGVLETVIHEKTGLLFNSQSKDALLKTLQKFEKMTWNPLIIHQHANNFSEERFTNEITAYVLKCEKEYFSKVN